MKLAIMPTATSEECPTDLDVICVPGGATGTLAAMADEATIAFLKDRGSRAKFVTSVCTGSLVLGAAGLLKGYRATSHWAHVRCYEISGRSPLMHVSWRTGIELRAEASGRKAARPPIRLGASAYI